MSDQDRTGNNLYRFDDVTVDCENFRVQKAGKAIALTPRAFDVLMLLLQNGGRVIEKQEFFERVWKDTFVSDNALTKIIKEIRHALDDDVSALRYIETVPKRGYRFIAGVTENGGAHQIEALTAPTKHLQNDENEATLVKEANLAHNISLLRKAFDDGSNGNKYIQTVPRRVYRWLVNVKEFRGEETPPLARPQPQPDTAGSQPEAAQQTEMESIADLSTDASVIPTDANSSSTPRARSHAIILIISLAIVIIAGAAIVLLLKSSSSAPPLNVTPLTSYAGRESQPAFSPDGSQIAFVWGGEKGDNTDIYVKLIDAGTPLRLTTDPANDTHPVWSPDGHYIAFIRAGHNSRALMVVPALGGTERKIADLRPSVLGGRLAWSPDGKTFAVSEQDASPIRCSIFSISYDTGEERQLTTPPAEDTGDAEPAFSPDGQTLAFIRVGHLGVNEIYLQPVTGGETRQLTFDKNIIGGLAWMPDGRELLFMSDRGGSFASDRLWRMSVAGGEATLVAGTGDHIASFAISHQGDRLAYEQRAIDANVWRVELQGAAAPKSPPVELIASTRYDFQPQYSPDGNQIAFVSDRSGNFEIWTCASDGSNPIQLTSFGNSIAGTPRWSPDGKQIVFDARPGGNADIYAIKATGNTPRRLTTEGSEDVVPSWSTDGRLLYFASNRNGMWQIWKMPAEGGAVEQVTHEGGFAPRPSPNGEYIYYNKEEFKDGPLWRVPTKGGAEEIVPGFTEKTRWAYWTVTANGIYFINTASGPNGPVEFFDLKTGQTTPIFTLEKTRAAGLTVSPDGRWLLYAQLDRNDSDLMLAENFR